ncbi:C40 family peptidase [Paenibacillus thermotolerans]|uniref:C40 family peptidase n=1 Tax=Paenibacillus thermotolerans TaxID=3027807 RepID=UPI00236764F8|nr:MULTISPECIES: C40 family peptidase [unclassified Paenibacillus]
MMKRKIAGWVAGGMIACSLGYGAAVASTSWPKAETLLVPFQWSVNGNVMSSDKPYYNGTEWVPSSMNYKGTTYIPIRLAAESLGFKLLWDQAVSTATLVDSESEEDPVSDLPGKYPSASITTSAQIKQSTWVMDQTDKDGKRLKEVKPGTSVIVMGESGERWIRVIAGNTIGFVDIGSTDYILAAQRPKWEQTADSIMAVGLKFLGTEYEFDAKLGQTNTFDCSSFVNFLYKLHGTDMPRNSRQQSAVGKTVSFEELRKGDLLFFTTPKREKNTGVARIGHVAIYAGNNKLLHTYRKGIGVTVTDMDANWKKRFIQAQRIIPE